LQVRLTSSMRRPVSVKPRVSAMRLAKNVPGVALVRV
jgi:hypothetical protein